MRRNGGVLGYACQSEKIKEICGKTFPQPFYLQGKGYRKCESNGRIFYIPLTAAEQRKLASQEMSVSDTTSNGFVAEPSIELAPKAPLYEPPPVSLPDTPPRSWIKLSAKLEEFVSTLSPRRKVACIICFCMTIFLFVYMVIQLGFSQGETNTGQNQGTLDDIFRMITDENMDIVIDSAQASIGIYQENGGYNLEDMVAQVKDRVLENPIYGDMVAQGLIGIDIATRGDLRENNPWLQEFVEKTDAAMSSSEAGQAGMRRWLINANKTPTTTDEYKDYADKLCLLLDYFTAERVDALAITQQWYIDPNTSGIYARAEESSEQTMQDALILVHRQADGRIGYMIGFAIEDGSVMICDPWKLGLDSFTG